MPSPPHIIDTPSPLSVPDLAPPIPGAASPPIPGTAAPPPPGTHSLIPHTFQADRILPRPGEAIKIRLARPLSGPGSTQGTQYSSDIYTATSRYRSRYHTAFVIDASLNLRGRVVNLKLWPTPSYSNAILEGFSSSIAYVASLEQHRKDRHIPAPFVDQAADLPVPETPAGFGAPLVIGGYQDRRPSWLLLEPQRAALRFTTKWKSFSPPVMLSIDESLRLLDECERLNLNDFNLRTSIPPSLPPPTSDATDDNMPDNRTGGPSSGSAPPGGAPSPGGGQVAHYHHTGTQQQLVSDFHTDFWRGFEHVPQLVIAESESGDDSEDEQEGPLSYARLMSPYSKFYRGIVRQHDKEAARNRDVRMMRWVEDVARCM